jgi:hypothetical protein
MRTKRAIVATAAALAVVAGAALAVTLPAKAETPECGSSCVELYGGLSGITLGSPGYLIDSYKQGDVAGTPIVQFAISNTEPAEDFTVDAQSLVSTLFANGVVSAAVDQSFADDAAYEIEYAPYGAATGLCVGVGAVATAGEKVDLEPCGVSGKTYWIADSSASITDSFVPLVNASTTDTSDPFVLTYPSGASPTELPRPQLEVDNLAAGQVPANQLWSALGAIDGADLSIAQPANITADATGPSGATVTYPLPAVTDPDDATPPTAVCTPPSGSVFPIGTTKVTCTATDADDLNSPVSTTFTITVKGTGLAIAQPANITTDATGPSGATVTYPLPAVTDPDNLTPPTAVCKPASGSLFPIGTTTVTCTATDDNDVITSVSTTFTITVNGAAAQLAALVQAANALGFGNIPALFAGIAQQQLAAGHATLACQTLNQFISDVRQQVPASTAATLIAAAERIQAVLGGCGSRPPL